MSLRGAASRRHLLRHPGQLALCVLGVAMGVAVVVSIDLAIEAAREGFRVSTETVSGRATHQVLAGPGGLPDSVFTRIRVGLGVRESAPVVEGLATTERLPGVALRLLGVDPFSEFPFRTFSAGGGDFDVGALLTRPGATVLLAETARGAGLEVGDRFEARVGGRPVDLMLAGTVEPEDALTREGLRDVAVMDIAQAQAVLGRTGTLDRIDLILPDGPEGDRLATEVREAIPRSATLGTAGRRATEMSGMIASFDLNLRALSLLAIVFGMFLIYNALNFSVVQRRELYGGLRTLGVTRGELFRTVLAEAAGIAVLGTVAGLLIGVALGQGLVRLVVRTINDLYFVLSVEALTVAPAVLAKGAALGIGATLLAAIPAARFAALASPRSTRLRSIGEERVRRLVPRAAAVGAGLAVAGTVTLWAAPRSVGASFVALFLIMIGVALATPLGMLGGLRLLSGTITRVGGVLGTLASRSVAASLSRTAPAVAALVVAVSVTVGLGVMITSFRGTLVRWLDGTLRADVYVSLPSSVASRAEGTLPTDLIDRLSAHPAVNGRSTYRGADAVADWGSARLVALDLDPRGERAFDFLDGDRVTVMDRFRTQGEVLVSEPLAFKQGLDVGSEVSLRTEGGPRSFRVAGVFYDYGSDQGTIMMSRSTYDRHWTDEGVTSLALFLEADADPGRVVGELQSLVDPESLLVSIRANRVLREGSLEVFDRTFQVTAVLRLLAFLVAFIGVLGALMALELERAREIGVLRANGLTPRQLWGLVTAQTGLMGFVSGVLAIPMGLVLAAVMVFVVNRRSFGWTLQMELGPELVWQPLVLALAGALLAGIYPAWKMSRTPPALALREE